MHLPSRYDQSRPLLHQSFSPRTKLPSLRVISQHTLTLQNSESKKLITIEEYLASNGASIEAFARLKVGEGIEVQTKDFAEEVAEQLK